MRCALTFVGAGRDSHKTADAITDHPQGHWQRCQASTGPSHAAWRRRPAVAQTGTDPRTAQGAGPGRARHMWRSISYGREAR